MEVQDYYMSMNVCREVEKKKKVFHVCNFAFFLLYSEVGGGEQSFSLVYNRSLNIMSVGSHAED